MQLACRFPNSVHGASKLVVNALATRLSRLINSGNLDEFESVAKLGLSILDAVEASDSDFADLYYGAVFFDEGFKAYVEGRSELFELSREMIERLSASSVVPWPQIMAATSPIGAYFGLGMAGVNSGNVECSSSVYRNHGSLRTI